MGDVICTIETTVNRCSSADAHASARDALAEDSPSRPLLALFAPVHTLNRNKRASVPANPHRKICGVQWAASRALRLRFGVRLGCMIILHECILAFGKCAESRQELGTSDNNTTTVVWSIRRWMPVACTTKDPRQCAALYIADVFVN